MHPSGRVPERDPRSSFALLETRKTGAPHLQGAAELVWLLLVGRIAFVPRLAVLQPHHDLKGRCQTKID